MLAEQGSLLFFLQFSLTSEYLHNNCIFFFYFVPMTSIFEMQSRMEEKRADKEEISIL